MTDKERIFECFKEVLKNKEDSYWDIKNNLIKMSLYTNLKQRNDIWFEFDEEGNLINLF